jgi:DNA-binding transcriptional MerR regulator
MATTQFTARQAARVAGLSYSTVAYWDRTDFLHPSVGGKGSARIYSLQDLVALRVAHDLREAGISLQALRQVVRRLHDKGGASHSLAEIQLLTDGRDVYEKRGDALLSILRKPGQGCLFDVVEVSQAAAEVQQAVAALDSNGENQPESGSRSKTP